MIISLVDRHTTKGEENLLDILDLTHTVDVNWLKGILDERKGIFHKSYVKAYDWTTRPI